MHMLAPFAAPHDVCLRSFSTTFADRLSEGPERQGNSPPHNLAGMCRCRGRGDLVCYSRSKKGRRFLFAFFVRTEPVRASAEVPCVRGTFILPRPELEQQVGASAYVSVPERPGWERASCARWAQLASRIRQQEAGIAAAGKDTSGGEVGQISGDGGGAGSGGFVAGSESGMSFDPAMRALESGWCPGAQT